MAELEPLDAYIAYLALRHAQDQEGIAAELALALLPLWSLVKFHALDASMTIWLPVALPRVQTAYLQSQRVAAVFTQNVRSAALPVEPHLNMALPNVEQPKRLSRGAFDFPEMGTGGALEVFDKFPAEDVKATLAIEADYNTKKQMPGPEKDLMQAGLVRSTGAAIRQAINGSRGVTQSLARRDRRVLGYARVTDSNPCSFCALLASRGTVFKKDSFSEDRKGRNTNNKSDREFSKPKDASELPEGFTDVAKVHNHCRCTLRPVYTRATAEDAAAKYWRDGWDEIAREHPFDSNSANRERFKEWHEANPYPGTQLDMYKIDKSLADRKEALLNSGFSPSSPQVQWVDRSRANVA